MCVWCVVLSPRHCARRLSTFTSSVLVRVLVCLFLMWDSSAMRCRIAPSDKSVYDESQTTMTMSRRSCGRRVRLRASADGGHEHRAALGRHLPFSLWRPGSVLDEIRERRHVDNPERVDVSDVREPSPMTSRHARSTTSMSHPDTSSKCVPSVKSWESRI